jgi:hypothetical protein
MGGVGKVGCKDRIANTEDDIDWSWDENGGHPSEESPEEGGPRL